MLIPQKNFGQSPEKLTEVVLKLPNHSLLYIIFISFYRDGICPIFGTHNTTFFTDKYADREIKDLIVICENNENGCAWSDILGNYEVRIQLEFSLKAFYFSEPFRLKLTL